MAANTARTRVFTPNSDVPPYVPNVALRGAERRLFGPAWADSLQLTKLPGELEPLQFERLCFCAYRARQLRRQGRPYAEWLRRHQRIRSHLVEINVGIAFGMVRKRVQRGGRTDSEELSSIAMEALLRAVDTFDPWRGWRFSTYATWAIRRAFCLRGNLDAQFAAQHITGLADEMPRLVPADYRITTSPREASKRKQCPRRTGYEDCDAEVVDLRGAMDRGLLRPVERRVLEGRFFDDLTLEDLGAEIGVSKERVRQIEAEALGILRAALTYNRSRPDRSTVGLSSPRTQHAGGAPAARISATT